MGSNFSRTQNKPPLRVPSSATIFNIYPGYSPKDESENVSQVVLTNRSQVVNTIVCLLPLIMMPSLEWRGAVSALGTTYSDNGWILSIFTRFWNGIAVEGSHLNYSDISVSCLAHFLESIRRFHTLIITTQANSPLVIRTSVISSQILARFLVTEQLHLYSPLEKMLCLNLLELGHHGRKSLPVRQSLHEYVVPALFSAKKNQDRFNGFSRDLQVSPKGGFLQIQKLIRYTASV